MKLFAVAVIVGCSVFAQQAISPAAQRHIDAARVAAGAEHQVVWKQLCDSALALPTPPATPADDGPDTTGAVPAPPAREQWYAEPQKVFDNLYFVGMTQFSAWAITTSKGIILLDAIFDYSVEAEVDEGLRKLGLNPTDIKYVVVSHGHPDHAGGARFLQQKYGARLLMSAADYDLLDRKDPVWKPKRDLVVTDAQTLTLGDTTMTFYLTPGHTEGTISTIFSVRDGGRRHTIATWGGTGFIFGRRQWAERLSRERLIAYARSAERFREIAAKANADVILSNKGMEQTSGAVTLVGRRRSLLIPVLDGPSSELWTNGTNRSGRAMYSVVRANLRTARSHAQPQHAKVLAHSYVSLSLKPRKEIAMGSASYETMRIGWGSSLLGVVLSALLGVPSGNLASTSELPRPHLATALPTAQGKPAITDLKEQHLYESLRAALEAARYRVRRNERSADAYDADNPAQHLTASFTPEGVELTWQPQAGGPQWRLGMTLFAYGYGNRIVELRAGQINAHDNRVDIARTAKDRLGTAVDEWYVNNADGLEQGFVVPQPPAGSDRGAAWLRLGLRVSGEMRPEVEADGQRLILKRTDGEVALSYRGLRAWDAAGRELSARMEVRGPELWLEVADGEAVYPVTIDPTFVEDQKLTASDGTGNNEFGFVAISGATLVVGADLDDIGGNVDQGSAYVFERQGQQWLERQKLTASDGAASDIFGYSVAISGDTIVVSAHNDDIGGNPNQGSAYVFQRYGSKWREQAKLTASDGAAFDNFGIALAISGSTIVVSAPTHDVGGSPDQGAAYVFERDGLTWVEQQKLTASDGTAGDLFGGFGNSVAISGATIVAGADFHDIGSSADQGSAYVFERDGLTWVEQQKLTASDGTGGDRFGVSVAISGATIVASASSHDVAGNANQGSAYVFERYGLTWVEQQTLTASDGAAGDGFGYPVAMSESAIVLAALGHDLNVGSAYVFRRQGGMWVQEDKLVSSDGVAHDAFGRSLAISATTIVVGAPHDKNPDRGSAYVFTP